MYVGVLASTRRDAATASPNPSKLFVPASLPCGSSGTYARHSSGFHCMAARREDRRPVAEEARTGWAAPGARR